VRQAVGREALALLCTVDKQDWYSCDADERMLD